jgi:hypothetical protein
MVLFYCPSHRLRIVKGAAMSVIDSNITGRNITRSKLEKRPKPEPEWESVADTAAAVGECRATIYEHIARGDYEAVKSGKRLLVNVASRREHYASLPKAVIKPRKSFEAAE